MIAIEFAQYLAAQSGNLTYDAAAMEHDHVISGVGSQRQLRDSTSQVLELKRHHPGLRILGAHDPAAQMILATPPTKSTTTPA